MTNKNTLWHWWRVLPVLVMALMTSLLTRADDFMLTFRPAMMQNQLKVTQSGENEWILVTMGGDPFVAMNELTRDLEDDETCFMFDYKLTANIGGGIEFFFCGPGNGPVAGREIVFGGLSKTDEWKSVIWDFGKARQDFNWGKKGDYVRFDAGNASGVTLTIRNPRLGKLPYDPLATYEISNAQEWVDFVQMVNEGRSRISAKLTADIDLSSNPNTMIGRFDGTIDGQGHKLTVAFDRTESVSAPIDNLYGTVKNLIVDGTIRTTNNFAAAIAGHLQGGTISNCVSLIDIISTKVGDGTHAGLCAVCEQPSVVENCVFAGSITSETTNNCGGIVGWSAQTCKIINCLMLANIQAPGSGCYTFSRNPGSVMLTNCYYLNAYGSVNSGGIQVTEADLKSGKTCYILNGDQSKIVMYQNLGEDNFPYPISLNHSQVYASGTLRCDGKPLGEVTYTNNQASAEKPDHQFEDGFCSVCGQEDPSYMTQIDGIYQISKPGQLKWLASRVNKGESPVSAVMLCDLDMSGIDMDPIGCDLNRFQGSFDGQGHHISNLTISRPGQQGVGLFGTVTGSVTVQNLVLDATCSLSGASYVAIIGCSKGDAKVTMKNLGNEGSVNVESHNAAGIIGSSDGSKGKFTMDMCYSTGSITGSKENGTLSGWVGSDAVITNCWSSATVTGHDSNPFFRGSGKPTNCWATVSQSNIKTFAAEEVETGALCFKMNSGSLSAPVWYQTIGKDTYPTWDSTHGIVYCVGDVYGDIHDDVSFEDYRSLYLQTERDYLQDVVATQELVEYYGDDLDALEEAETREDFLLMAEDVALDKALLVESAATYVKYEQKVADVALYLQDHHDFGGPGREKVESYVQDEVEPGDVFPNGSYVYIMDNLLLHPEEVLEEIDYLDKLLSDAIAEGVVAGADMTQLIANADFSDGFNSWEGKVATSTAGTEEGTMRGAECYNNTFDMHQTITGLKNGVYLFQLNGAYRPAQDRYSTNYIANFYAGDNMTYLQADIEDMISVEDAKDRVNCWIGEGVSIRDLEVFADGECTSSEFDDPIGYVMHGIQSVCYAALGGRYPNAILANVTDGTLTLGIASPGSGQSCDWTGFANLKLTYCGSLEQAGEALDQVLAGNAARAKTLIEYVCFDNERYAERPNYSKATRDALAAAVAAIETAQTAAAKYALIEQFSKLFRQVYEEKMAYIQVANVAESIAESYIDSENPTNPVNEVVYRLCDEIWAAYSAGSYSAQEALDKIVDVRLQYPAYLLVSRTPSGNNSAIEQTAPNTYHITCTNSSDPQVSIGRLTEDLREGHTILTFEYKSDGNYRGEFFFADPLAAGREFWYDLSKTPVWTRFYVDLSEPMTQFNWGHAGDWLRWDFINDGWADIWVRKMEFVDQARLDELMENSMAKHAGTEADPYPIYTLEDLYQMNTLTKQGVVTYFTLENDIDMSGIDWTPLNLQDNNYLNWINFDGKGHVLSHLTSGNTQQYSGFFGVLCGACRNVGFADVDIDSQIFGTGVIGGYVGHSSFLETTYVENVWVTGKVNVTNTGYAGNIAGNIGGPTVIRNVYANTTLTSKGNLVGGLVGRVRGQLTIENAYAAGQATDGAGNICGIVGGGQNTSTPASTYNNIVVWNNTSKTFGSTVDGDQISNISYYDGLNFAELQKTVVGWGAPWSCSMNEGEYPVFNLNADGIQGVKADNGQQTSDDSIYNLSGQRIAKPVKGLYIQGGKKIVK